MMKKLFGCLVICLAATLLPSPGATAATVICCTDRAKLACAENCHVAGCTGSSTFCAIEYCRCACTGCP